MKIKEFLLYDNALKDKTEFMDLITLDNECEVEKIQEAINECRNKDYKENGFYTYTNEDIYEAIREKCGDFTIKYLGNLDQFEY